jgi:hypothetical protein
LWRCTEILRAHPRGTRPTEERGLVVSPSLKVFLHHPLERTKISVVLPSARMILLSELPVVVNALKFK